MVHKQVLVIQEEFLTPEENREISEVQFVTTFCCFGRGLTSLRALFNKNVFRVDECAEGRIVIDNSRCSRPIKSVIFAIEQVLT